MFNAYKRAQASIKLNAANKLHVKTTKFGQKLAAP